MWCLESNEAALPVIRNRIGQIPSNGQGDIIYKSMVRDEVLSAYPLWARGLYDDLPPDENPPSLEAILNEASYSDFKRKIDSRLSVILDEDYPSRRHSARDMLSTSAVSKKAEVLAAA